MEVVSFLSIFLTIFNELLMIKELAPWADGDRQVLRQLHRLKMDFELLYLFSSCLQTWDEQSRNRLRSIITPLRLLWSEKHNGRTNLNLDTTWPVDVQAFRTLAFQLEVKIQQSKLLVQQWCEYFMCSASEQYNSSTYYYMRYPIRMIRSSLDRFSSYIGANVFPYENPIDILNDKLAFLDEFVKNSDSCTDSNKLLLIENFVVAFADKAICLACLYWANEDDEEIEIEMDIVLFDMLQKFIPYAPDITIQMSESLQASSDSIVVSATVASFVDFFFEHLDDDDFLILRDPLIQLFTSLANPPHDYAAAEEEDLLSSQVYALFREHSYLHLYLGEMKEVFSNKKMLLSDFTNQIEIANAKIRQLYYGRFSDCRISLEAEKMDYIYFISVARELYLIEMYVNWADLVRSQLHLYRMELKFMRPFLLCFATWDDADEEVKARLSFMITSLQGIWRKEEADKGLLAVRFRAIRRGDIADWHALAFELERKIQLSKVVMKAWCVNMFRWSFQYKPSANNKVLMHLNSILENLNDLVTYKAGEIVPFKKQIETLQDKSVFLRNFLELTMTSIDNKVFGEFTMFVQVFANEATCLTFLFLEKDDSEKIASEVNPMLSHMLQKINPAMPHVARLYFGILKALYLQQCDSLLFGQTASIFVDFFIENHLATPFEDDFQILHDELIFLLTFLNDPPNRNSEEVICSLIDYLFWEDVYAFLPFDDTEGDFVKKKMILIDFIIKFGTANAKIRLLYSEFQDSSSYNFPKVISPSFLDFIMQKLRNLKERMISDR